MRANDPRVGGMEESELDGRALGRARARVDAARERAYVGLARDHLSWSGAVGRERVGQ